jgi:hypothetical protein
MTHTCIPALGTLRQEDHEFEISLGYHSKTLSQKATTKSKFKKMKCGKIISNLIRNLYIGYINTSFFFWWYWV